MMYLFLKFTLSATVLVAVSEISKRSSLFGALLASLPLTSVLALCWFYHDTKDPIAVAKLATDILWLVIPSLLLFLALPWLLRKGMHFYGALVLASLLTASAYAIFIKLRSTI